MLADMLYQYSTSLNAQLTIAFHTNRLRGIGYLRDRCWPPQRSPGWINGDSEGRSLSRGCPPDASADRKEIDHDGGRTGLVGITQYARLEHLSEWTALHRMSAPVVFKAACALLNGRLSGQSDVLFTSLQAGRQWPFMDDAIARHLPNPILIAGNTLTLVVNRIHIEPREKVGVFLEGLDGTCPRANRFNTRAAQPSQCCRVQIRQEVAA